MAEDRTAEPTKVRRASSSFFCVRDTLPGEPLPHQLKVREVVADRAVRRASRRSASTNPASTSVSNSALLPLETQDYRQAVTIAYTPHHRLALAAIHAVRPAAIMNLRLDDLELGDRGITVTTAIKEP